MLTCLRWYYLVVLPPTGQTGPRRSGWQSQGAARGLDRGRGRGLPPRDRACLDGMAESVNNCPELDNALRLNINYGANDSHVSREEFIDV